MYEPMWPFLLTYGSHEMRLTGFRRLTVVNGTPGKWGVTIGVGMDLGFVTHWHLHWVMELVRARYMGHW